MKPLRFILSGLLALVIGLSAATSSAKSSKSSSGGTVHVKGYTKKDGTYVPPHTRSAPNGTKADNWSTRGNVNPYTGQVGTEPLTAPTLTPTTSQQARTSTAVTSGAAKGSFKSLRIGMTSAEVLAALGSPPVATASVWSYPGAGYVEFSATNRLSSIRPGESYVVARPVAATGGMGLSPSSSQAPPFAAARSNDVYVQPYQRSDGTVVQGHYRTAPNGTKNDNYSTRGNVNPYTGVAGTKPRDGETTQQRSRVELELVVQQNTQLLDSYVRAPFGKSPFNAEKYDKLKEARDAAAAELKAGR